MPARGPREKVTTATRSPRALLEKIDVVGRADAADDVAFGVAQRDRAASRGRRTAGRAVGQRIRIAGRRRHARTGAIGADEIFRP